jgi:uncharacterized membrane protein YphA (DoxX/SURF4 family)
MISQQRLKDVERVVRLTMILILVTAGASKFFSHGGFFDYYSQLFQGDLRIQLPPVLVSIFLSAVPYVEVLLGLGLLLNRFRSRVIYAWFVFMWSLLFGHYILQEWSAVNQMLDYVFLGVLCFVLPHHSSWFRRDVEVSS